MPGKFNIGLSRHSANIRDWGGRFSRKNAKTPSSLNKKIRKKKLRSLAKTFGHYETEAEGQTSVVVCVPSRTLGTPLQIRVEVSQEGPGWAKFQGFKFYSLFLRLWQQVNIKDW